MDRQPDTTNKSPLSIRRVGSQVESTTRCLIECDRGQAQGEQVGEGSAKQAEGVENVVKFSTKIVTIF